MDRICGYVEGVWVPTAAYAFSFLWISSFTHAHTEGEWNLDLNCGIQAPYWVYRWGATQLGIHGFSFLVLDPLFLAFCGCW